MQKDKVLQLEGVLQLGGILYLIKIYKSTQARSLQPLNLSASLTGNMSKSVVNCTFWLLPTSNLSTFFCYFDGHFLKTPSFSISVRFGAKSGVEVEA